MNDPVGYIDSGVGGLTVVKQALSKISNQPIVYIGDEKRMPYGTKSKTEIIDFTDQMTNFLIENKKIKLLVIACNTATAQAMPTITEKYDLPIIGVIDSGAMMAAKATKTKKVAVIATQATVDSNAYPKAINQIDQQVQIQQLATPDFVQLVESGEYQASNAQEIVNETLKDLADFDTLILGCTHFPIIEDLIQNAVGNSVQLINPAIDVVDKVEAFLNNQQIDDSNSNNNLNQYLTTGDLARFDRIASDWLGEKIDAKQLRVVNNHLEEE